MRFSWGSNVILIGMLQSTNQLVSVIIFFTFKHAVTATQLFFLTILFWFDSEVAIQVPLIGWNCQRPPSIHLISARVFHVPDSRRQSSVSWPL